jgi:SRSO17 transposase
METETNVLLKAINEEFLHIEGNFSRKDVRETAYEFICALLSKAERKNAWQLSESAGKMAPHRFQNFIANAKWSSDNVRDHIIKSSLLTLGQGGTVVIDETGFLKKGRQSAGVKRQYSGTAGRIENCQIGVFASYRTARGHTLIDRELYVPKEWAEDAERCKKAGIPADRPFLTKPRLGTQMIDRALENGAEPRWATADEAYGRDPEFRRNLEEKKLPYVLATPKDTHVRVGLKERRADDFIADVAEDKWTRISCGLGSKGERIYDWCAISRDELSPKGFGRFILARRSVSDASDIAFYVVFCKEGTSLKEMVLVAGERWSIEECFESAKGETGIDHYEVRSFTGWNRHVTLSMFALALLRRAQACLAEIPAENVGSMDEFKKKRNL